MSCIKTAVAVSALLLAARVGGHGYPGEVIADGVSSPANIPSWTGNKYTPFPTQTVWDVSLPDWGTYVPKERINDPDIICHIGAKPVSATTPVVAGHDVTVHFPMWTQSGHSGSLLVYLANCRGNCSQANIQELKWFKIYEQGMLEDSKSPLPGLPMDKAYVAGKWATDVFVQNQNASHTTIPMVTPGNYLMRHEFIVLSNPSTGPQFYPYCANLLISGAGTMDPDGVRGQDLYQISDKSFHVDVYNPLGSYKVPGPAVISGAGSSSLAPASLVSTSSSSSSSSTTSLVAGAVGTSSSSTPSTAPSSSSSSVSTTTAPGSVTAAAYGSAPSAASISTSSSSSFSSSSSSSSSSSLAGAGSASVSAPAPSIASSSSSSSSSSSVSAATASLPSLPSLPSDCAALPETTTTTIVMVTVTVPPPSASAASSY
ncbi:MAG: hypothetical protein M1826_003447 [Phylliscum demangeonii]|nr:MAG: hypothetical protein M1826_003447 [Phylliscum demangeonii]